MTVAPPAAAEPGAAPAVEDSVAVEGSARARATNAALRALARASRAFALYDPGNDIIRRFLDEYRAALDTALKGHGGLELSVAPFELKLGAETVYREEDRERSLAFRLFRDGIRGLSLQPGLSWEESVRLLEILSVRFTGVRQQEDDLVTLFRKAAFTHLSFTAAEGFVPREDHPETKGGEAAPTASSDSGFARAHAMPPADFDLPLPPSAPGAFLPREVPAAWLEALRAEEGPQQVPALAVRLAAELLRSADGPSSPLSVAEVVPLLEEVRDYCVADGRLDALGALVKVTQSAHGIGSDAVPPVIAALATPARLDQLLDGLPADTATPPPALVALLQALPGHPVGHLLTRLGAATDPKQKALLQALVGSLAASDTDDVVRRLRGADRETAGRLVPVLLATAPERAAEVGLELAGSPDASLQLTAAELLRKVPADPAVATALVRLARVDDEAVATAAVSSLGARREPRSYDAVLKVAEARAATGHLSRELATALGEALATLSPTTALQTFRQWATVKEGLLGRLVHSPQVRAHQLVAVAGLAALPVSDAEALILQVQGQAHDEELRKHCVGALLRRRRAAGAPHG